MHVWRLTRRKYADLSGIGAALAPGRWNRSGQRVVYTAEHPALAALEVLVHLGLDLELLPLDYVLLDIGLPVAQIERATGVLAPRAARTFGSTWLLSGAKAALAVPSAVVPNGWNYLINPAHAASSRIRVLSYTPFTFDRRLLRVRPAAPVKRPAPGVPPCGRGRRGGRA